MVMMETKLWIQDQNKVSTYILCAEGISSLIFVACDIYGQDILADNFYTKKADDNSSCTLRECTVSHVSDLLMYGFVDNVIIDACTLSV